MQKSAPSASLELPLIPSVTMLTALWGVILDTEHTLASDTPDTAKLSAIAGYIDERVPGHQAGVAWGSSPDEVTALIAARLIATDGPATSVFARLLRRDIALHVVGPHLRLPDAAEQDALRLRPGEQLYVREGYLMAGTIQCAKVTLKIAPDRVIREVSPAAWGLIRSGVPCGTVLGRSGLRRPRRRVEVRPGDTRVILSSASLYLGALPIGFADEAVPDSLVRWLAQCSAAAV
jgi:hypothetical protein